MSPSVRSVRSVWADVGIARQHRDFADGYTSRRAACSEPSECILTFYGAVRE